MPFELRGTTAAALEPDVPATDLSADEGSGSWLLASVNAERRSSPIRACTLGFEHPFLDAELVALGILQDDESRSGT